MLTNRSNLLALRSPGIEEERGGWRAYILGGAERSSSEEGNEDVGLCETVMD